MDSRAALAQGPPLNPLDPDGPSPAEHEGFNWERQSPPTDQRSELGYPSENDVVPNGLTWATVTFNAFSVDDEPDTPVLSNKWPGVRLKSAPIKQVADVVALNLNGPYSVHDSLWATKWRVWNADVTLERWIADPMHPNGGEYHPAPSLGFPTLAAPMSIAPWKAVSSTEEEYHGES